MAWVDLSDVFTYGSFLTSTQIQNLRDNIAAAFAKDSGAPTLANFYVSSSMIGSCQIGAAHINSYSITGDRIGTFAIINRCMAINSVTSSNILVNSVSSGHIAAGHVGSAHIAAGHVGSAHIAAASIGSSHLAPLSVGSSQIGLLAIGSSHLNVYCVGNEQLAFDIISTNRIMNDVITQAKLNTTLGVEAMVDLLSATWANFELDGGTYGFYPQIKFETGALNVDVRFFFGFSGVEGDEEYTSRLVVTHASATNKEVYVQQRYIDACSEVYFIFVLRYKDNKKITRIAFKPNHPAFMSGQDPANKPHPWVKIYDPDKHEIIIIFPSNEELKEMKKLQNFAWGNPEYDLTQVLRKFYDIVIDDKLRWPKTKVTMFMDPETKQDVKFPIPKPAYLMQAKLVRKN